MQSAAVLFIWFGLFLWMLITITITIPAPQSLDVWCSDHMFLTECNNLSLSELL